MRSLPALALLVALLASPLASGCGESAAHSTGSDYRYYDTDQVILLVDRQHFGGGQPLSPTRTSYPYGFELTNASRLSIAERVRVRIRLFDASGLPADDHLVELGDMRPGETRAVSGAVEAPALYSNSDVTLIWQSNSRVFSVDLKRDAYKVIDLGTTEY